MSSPEPRKPTRQERLRPLELIGLSAVFAVFTGLVVLLSTRELTLAAIFFGAAFVVAIVVIAMLGLAIGFGEGTTKGGELPRDDDRGADGSAH